MRFFLSALQNRFVLILFLFGAFANFAFSERILSPVQGTFSNKQTLLIDLSDGSEAFYSFSGENPLESGLAYDSPVILDATGEVSLYVTIVKSQSQTEKYHVNYTVKEDGNPFATGTPEKDFIDRITGESIILFTSGDTIKIPPSLSFSIGNPDQDKGDEGENPFLKGRTLAVSADNRLSRYVPCRITDGSRVWRFVFYIFAGESSEVKPKKVPFEISDWDFFKFTGKNLIWTIDNGTWSASTKKYKIDRTRTHVIYWQSVAYKAGNPVQSFVLPPKPELKIEKYDKAAVFSLSGDEKYSFSVISSGASGGTQDDKGAHKSITFDTFEGDSVRENAVFAVYCDGVFQGSLSGLYEIDRKPPLPPKFYPSTLGEYARKDVSVSVASEKDSRIYVSVSGPHIIRSGSYLNNNSELDFLTPNEYSPYSPEKPIPLSGGNKDTVGYKVFAYAVDRAGNKSPVSSYQVVIDEYNYFLDGSASSLGADGTRLHPYNSFSEVIKAINSSDYSHFFVSGTVVLPENLPAISANCSFTGTKGARFLAGASSAISVKGASVEFENCIIEKSIEKTNPEKNAGDSESGETLFELENSAALFKNCEIVGNFSSSGILFSAKDSAVTIKDSGVTAQGKTYASDFAGTDCEIEASKTRFAAIADTAVIFSISGGSASLEECECTVVSHLGRILEATGAKLRLVSNKYKGEFDGKTKNLRNTVPIWKDEKSYIIEERENTEEGF